MKCVHLNIRSASFLLLAVILNSVQYTHMANNVQIDTSKDNFISQDTPDQILECPSDKQCSQLNYPCIKCDTAINCVYGEEKNVSCKIIDKVKCLGEEKFTRKMICRYCYQTEDWEHKCILQSNCNSVATPRQYYKTNCTVDNGIVCMGNRKFQKRLICNWTRGYRWSTALVLSITLGGFGTDRFYLGHWQEGIGKLFSFGGLGVWTLIDVILISLHYLGPADGSLYL